MPDYKELLEIAEEQLSASNAHHVYIAVMDDDGKFRSLRLSELNASCVKPFIRQIRTDPTHHVDCNITEVTGTGSQSSQGTWTAPDDDG